MKIDVPDSDLKGFNDQAKQKLSAVSSSFVADLIAEANRIEATRKTTGGDAEITSSMINDAGILLRRGLATPKKGNGVKVLRVTSAILSLSVGMLFDTQQLQNSAYMLLFIGVLTAAVICVTISTILE